MWQTELMLFGRLNIITNYGITKKLFKFVDTLYKDSVRGLTQSGRVTNKHVDNDRSSVPTHKYGKYVNYSIYIMRALYCKTSERVHRTHDIKAACNHILLILVPRDMLRRREELDLCVLTA